MNLIEVTTDAQRNLRKYELKSLALEEEKEHEEARKNKGFTQVYPKGWKRVRELSKENAGAAGLYAFFAEHIDPTCGAVICDQQFLANQFEITTRTVRRWLDFLENKKAVIRIPVSGRIYAYALDPHEVWKGYNTRKEYAAFLTKTLVDKSDDIKRRIMSMFSPENKKNLIEQEEMALQIDLEDYLK
ncbi:replication protein RepA [Bartonella schoenbuchensis]|uniref:Replication protein RepA n=1 Tax=Bartonella schoenbuchensis m07a TaxID=1094496 RepID=N6V9K0_9HYPH|nr:replication protein RepA [Bartonella schoenbuchensis]ENN89886.1 replication protein RepA [Bartonella schoenbuchensis m07a]